MQFSVATLAFFVNLALSAAVPEAAPAGMVQKLDTRDVSENLIFGRSFPCASNDPTTCCAVSHICAVSSHHHTHCHDVSEDSALGRCATAERKTY